MKMKIIPHPCALILHNAPVQNDEQRGHMERFSALIGFFLILAIAYGLSNNKQAIRWKTVMWGLILQILTAIAVLKGELIASLFHISGNQTVAALVFVVVAVIVYFIATRLGDPARRYLW